jgi:hypothetical protein
LDGRPIFDTHLLTLNTVIAVLSTAAKANLLVVVANCVGQWKWILFAGSPRRLLDFERLDQASRGPLGGLKLLFNAKVTDACVFCSLYRPFYIFFFSILFFFASDANDVFSL